MTDLRDKIIQTLDDHNIPYQVASIEGGLADAILATIRENIALSWDARNEAETIDGSVYYVVEDEYMAGFWACGVNDNEIAAGLLTEQAAKAAALEHHRDSVMQQMGVK